MWKNSLKNVDSDNNKILYKTLLDFFLQRNGTYFLNKPRIYTGVFRVDPEMFKEFKMYNLCCYLSTQPLSSHHKVLISLL